MKSIFDQSSQKEIVGRIESLNANQNAQWGKMSINQMLRHCILWDQVAQGKKKLKQPFLGKLFGKLFLKGLLKDDSHFKHHLPAVSELKINHPVENDVDSEKKNWISLIKEYPNLSIETYRLPFFGRVKKEEVGYMAYKHSDHHLRQFSA